MPYCPKCGKEVRSDTKFCTNCGTTLEITASSEHAPSAYVPSSPLSDLGPRIVAGIIDYIIIGLVAGILAVFLLVPWVMTGARLMGTFGPAWVGGILGIVGVMWILWLI